MKTALYTFVALIAFAGNSVLCRLALEPSDGPALIDPASFTALRLVSGVLVLFCILAMRQSRSNHAVSSKGKWFSGVMLFVYAATFSYAYSVLDTATGALILFGCVQLTMIGVGLLKGASLSMAEGFGFVIAFLGLVYLMLPGIEAPSFIGFVLMVVAGVAWGLYSISGKSSQDALSDTAYNFARTLPFVLVLLVLMLVEMDLERKGVALALVSGGLASGVGYAIWFVAVRGLSNTQAAAVQLLVPVIASVAGVVIVGELITGRLIISSLLILSGVALAVLSNRSRLVRT